MLCLRTIVLYEQYSIYSQQKEQAESEPFSNKTLEPNLLLYFVLYFGSQQ